MQKHTPLMAAAHGAINRHGLNCTDILQLFLFFFVDSTFFGTDGYIFFSIFLSIWSWWTLRYARTDWSNYTRLIYLCRKSLRLVVTCVLPITNIYYLFGYILLLFWLKHFRFDLILRNKKQHMSKTNHKHIEYLKQQSRDNNNINRSMTFTCFKRHCSGSDGIVSDSTLYKKENNCWQLFRKKTTIVWNAWALDSRCNNKKISK